MKIYTTITMRWDENTARYAIVPEESEWYLYAGPVALCCGATTAQNQVLQGQQQQQQQLAQQASQVFGNSSEVFQDLMNTFAPTVAAGPNQQGFSAPELGNLNSQAITQTGQAYKNAKEALGENQAAAGGGTTGLASGAQTGEDLSLAESGANQTASELGSITAQNYATGRQNYDTAVSGLASSPGAFGMANQAGYVATGAGSAAANTANQIATQNNSWVQAVTGALGGVAGAALGGGGLSNLLGAKSGGGGDLPSALGGSEDPMGLNYNGIAPSPLPSGLMPAGIF